MSVEKRIFGKLGVVCDLSNMFKAGKKIGLRPDYSFLRNMPPDCSVVSAKAFGSLPPDSLKKSQYDAQMDFLFLLSRLSWEVTAYPLLRVATPGSERPFIFREDELSVDGGVRETIRNFAKDSQIESILILAGDGGYTAEVSSAVSAGKKVIVASWQHSVNSSLVEAASGFINISEEPMFNCSKLKQKPELVA